MVELVGGGSVINKAILFNLEDGLFCRIFVFVIVEV